MKFIEVWSERLTLGVLRTLRTLRRLGKSELLQVELIFE